MEHVKIACKASRLHFAGGGPGFTLAHPKFYKIILLGKGGARLGQIAVWLCIVIAILAAASGTAAFFLGMTYRKNKAESEIGSAEQEAKRIVADAVKSAEAKKRNRAGGQGRTAPPERRIGKKEAQQPAQRDPASGKARAPKGGKPGKKLESMERKENQADQKTKRLKSACRGRGREKSQFDMLEKISNFTVDQAKEYLLNNLESELTHEKGCKDPGV